MLRLIDRYLDPSESPLEILFGLIMALTMTAGARLLSDPDEIGRLDLALGLRGCNVAWGLIDAVFYRLGSQFDRNRRVRFTCRLQGAASDEEAIGLVREEVGLECEPRASHEDREAPHRSLLALLPRRYCLAGAFHPRRTDPGHRHLRSRHV